MASIVWLAVGLVAALVPSGLMAFLAYRAGSYDRRPAPEALWTYGDLEPDEIRYQFLSKRFRAIAGNRGKLKRKARFLAASLGMLAMIALGVAMTAIVELIT